MATFGWKKALVIVGFAALPSMASATLIATIAGNDCAGVFGQGFANCKIPGQYDPNQSPVIIKFTDSWKTYWSSQTILNESVDFPSRKIFCSSYMFSIKVCTPRLSLM